MKMAVALLMLLTAGVASGVNAQGVCRKCESIEGCGECALADTNLEGAFNCYVLNGHCYLDPPYCSVAAGCFLGDVTVATPAGDVPIRDLAVGALVLSRDQKGAPVNAMVTSREVFEAWSYLDINGRIQVTDAHPFFIDAGWTNAGDLVVGDEIVLLDGQKEPIVSIERVDKGVRVYTISVGETETFFANAAYVHNKPPIIGQ